jgi:hypothetical protein
MFRIFILCLLISITAACSEPVDYRFGFSAEESDRFYLVTAEFDDYMNVPAGIIGCCLASGSASASMFPEKYPRKGYFVWHDKPADIYYHATLNYPKNLKEIADDLPEFISVTGFQGKVSKKPKQIYILSSITSKNEVVSWISNRGIGGPYVKRNLIELDRAKGEPFVPEFIKERRRKKALQAQEDAYNGND